MKKEIIKATAVTLICCCEEVSKGNKGILSFVLTFACIFCRSVIFGDGNNKHEKS